MENETTINDLNVNETVEAEIKGGPKKIFIGGLSVTETALPDLEPEGNVMDGRTDGPGSGGPVLNHNETTANDEEAETEALADLSVEDDEQVKGGPGEGSSTVGGVFLNHNETTAADDEADESETLDDLTVSDDEAVNAGGNGGGGGGITFNHNETTVADDADAEELDDLAVSDEAETAVKGGAVKVGKLLGVGY